MGYRVVRIKKVYADCDRRADEDGGGHVGESAECGSSDLRSVAGVQSVCAGIYAVVGDGI